MTRTWTVDRPDEGVRGWLVVDTLRGGLAFGGTRFTPDLRQDEVAELARCMTWKLAAHGLPMGGADAEDTAVGKSGAAPARGGTW